MPSPSARCGSGVFLGLGVLLKFMPIVLLPFLMLDGRRLRYRLPAAAVITIAARLWRKPAHLGAFDLPPADLRGGTIVASPIDLPVSQGALIHRCGGWISSMISIRRLRSSCSRHCLDLATGRRRMIEPFPSAVLAILVTLMFYQVGFAQYHMVLFVLASYWMVRARRADTRDDLVWIALACYFGWLSYFNSMLATEILMVYGMQSWIGLPTFLLGCFLAVEHRAIAIDRHQARTRPAPGESLWAAASNEMDRHTWPLSGPRLILHMPRTESSSQVTFLSRPRKNLPTPSPPSNPRFMVRPSTTRPTGTAHAIPFGNWPRLAARTRRDRARPGDARARDAIRTTRAGTRVRADRP